MQCFARRLRIFFPSLLQNGRLGKIESAIAKRNGDFFLLLAILRRKKHYEPFDDHPVNSMLIA